MIVCKFGGTSMQDADAIRRAARIVAGRVGRGPVVVVSAMAGVTNALIGIAQFAAAGKLIQAVRAVEELRERHLAECDALLDRTPECVEVAAELGAMFDELASLAEALSTLGHCTPRSLDAVSSYGERLSAPLAAAAFRTLGLNARHVDPREVVITDDTYGKGEPLPEAIAEAARVHLLPLVKEGVVPVLGGYVAATRQGVTTTLGRGGSDYSASLIGAAMQAEDIEIWTDVDGMLTADPRVVPDARILHTIRFDEASELAALGAKVLHPSTIAPAVRLGIPVWIFNSRNPEGKGTRIAFDAPRRAVAAIAGKGGVTVVRVRSTRMLHAHGFLRRIFEVFERHRTSVDVVATSEIEVSLTVDEDERIASIVAELMAFGDVSVERDRGLVAIVGAALGDDTRAMARALGALAELRVHMVSLSATGINLTMVLDAAQVNTAMRLLHDACLAREVAA